MTQDETAADAVAFAPIASRYEVLRELGRGGMASIHLVVDRNTGQKLALKRLLRTEAQADHALLSALFEQEFHTLSQLAHPRIVRAFDFLRFDASAFYTMELLDGGDLTELTPLPWQRVCSLLIDVCSALSLLHSRRLVHRDLTPRNVRCTQDGAAKLIDFGAMMRFGTAKRLVGTPAYVAPEALDGQPLDGRADLFALGATAYYALTGRHAFPARSMAAARTAHASPPLAPSSIVVDIPAALDQLVMSLLQVSPLARPANAAEVMERLSAISDIAIDEQLAIRSAYLATPTLVGREAALSRAHKHIERALIGRGNSFLISGPAGVGRTRVVDACLLEAKLMGALGLRTDADDSSSGDFGSAVAIGAHLIDAVPELALPLARAHAAVLAHVMPDILRQVTQLDVNSAGPATDAAPLVKLEIPSLLDRRARIQSALRDWLRSVAAERCLMIAIDDYHALDEPSRALFASLAHQARDVRLVIAASVDNSVPLDRKDSLGLLLQAARVVRLKPLDVNDTQALLSSMFGDVPNVTLLSHRLHEASGGSPRELMQLAQQLVDDGVVFYAGGTWTLPSELQRVELPRSQADALARRLPQLRDGSRELAQMFALSPRRALSLADCALLSKLDHAGTLDLLNELLAANIVSGDGVHYRLSGPSWQRVLRHDVSEQAAPSLHAQLAALPWNSEGERFESAQHLWRAGDRQRALGAMVEHALTVEQNYTLDAEWFFEYVRSLPGDWVESCEAFYQASLTLGLSRRERYSLLSHMVGAASPSGRTLPQHLRACLQELYDASGLRLYDELTSEPDPGKRLQQALTLAQQRFEQTPEHERPIPVGEAIPRLARCIVHAIALVGRGIDFPLMTEVPSLAPFAGLSPILAAVQRNAECTLYFTAGRFDRAREGYLELRQRMDQGNLDDPRNRAMYLAITYAIGAIETATGIEDGERWADLIQDHSLFAVNAWRLRLMAALRQGNFQRAEELEQKVELIRIQNSPPQLFEGTLLWVEAICYAMSDDLARTKQIIPRLASLAAELPKWAPTVQYAKAQYQRLRGDHTRALSEIELGMAMVEPGRHLAWAALAGAHVSAILATGQAELAAARGREYLAATDTHNLQCAAQPILQGLALAEASLGDFIGAEKHAQASVDVVYGFGTRGVGLACAYETQARVAILLKDPIAFRRYSTACAQLYKAGNNPSLTAKYERLLFDARYIVRESLRERSVLSMGDRVESRIQTLVTSTLGGCHDVASRAQQALRLLVEHTASTGGYLYTLQHEGLALRAQHGPHAPLKNMDELAAAYLASELDEADDITATDSGETGLSTLWAAPEGRFMPLIMAHSGEQGRMITGVALLYLPGDRNFAQPGALVPALSRALADSDDVRTALAPI